MTKLNKIGRTIAKVRREKGMTQEDLAGVVGMDRSYLSEIENGYKNLSVLVLLDIAEALGVLPSRLLGE